MGRWWWTSAAEPRTWPVALACAGALLLAGCGDRKPEATDSRGRPLSAGSLPTPAAAGGSVTGMPTSPPAGGPADAVELPPPQPVAIEPGVPVDSESVPVDPATGLALPSAPEPSAAATPAADVSGAGTVVREYMARLGAGAFAGAQQLWSTTPNDSAVLQLARGAAFAVDVLAPVANADPAASGVATVPVRLRGATDQREVLLSATYTVRRTPEGAWRIASATVREESP